MTTTNEKGISILRNEYLIYLQNLRNDFYNRGNIAKAEEVQEQINKEQY